MEVSPNCVYSSSFKTWFLELGLGQNRRGDFYIGINRVLSLKTFILKKKQNVMKCAKIEREKNVKFYRYFHIWYLIKKKAVRVMSVLYCCPDEQCNPWASCISQGMKSGKKALSSRHLHQCPTILIWQGIHWKRSRSIYLLHKVPVFLIQHSLNLILHQQKMKINSKEYFLTDLKEH